MAVLMPTTSPLALASGPPEFPGASRTVARTQLRRPMPGMGPTEWITPVVKAPENPRGLPIAITSSPGRSALESPAAAAGRLPAGTRRTARSRRASYPSMRASNRRPSHNSTSLREEWATCALVTIIPSAPQITPEPPLRRLSENTCTVERRSCSATSPNVSMSVPPRPLADRDAHLLFRAPAQQAGFDGLSRLGGFQRGLDLVRVG